MGILMLLIGLCLSSAFFWLSTRTSSFNLRSGIFHYYTLIGLMVALYQVDFYWVYLSERSYVVFRNQELDKGSVLVANTLFLASNFLVLLLSSALTLSRPYTQAVNTPAAWCSPVNSAERISALTVWICAGLFWLVFFFKMASAIGSFDILSFTTQRFVVFSQNKIMHYVAFWLPPAFTILAFTHGTHTKLTRILLFGTIFAMIVTGSRDRVVWALVAFGIASTRNKPISSLWLLPTVPLLFIGLYSFLAIFRPHMDYDVVSILNPINLFEHIVTSREVTVPDNLSSIEYGFQPDRNLFSSIVNIITYPIPRDLLGGLKTYGAAVDFTLEIRPESWLLGRSATTLSGFGELRLEMGYFYPFFASFYVSGLVFFMHIWSQESSPLSGAKYTLGFWILFHFYRTGLSELGNFIWLSVLSVISFGILAKILSAKRNEHIA